MRVTKAHPLFAITGIATAALLAFGPAASAETKPNKPPKGFVALFNGKDLTNWQGLIELPKRDKMTPEQRKAEQAKADELMRQHWSVQDGVLVYDGKGQSLQSAKDYGDFELYVDWKILPQGDSGIYLRGNPQVQIWDATPPAMLNGKFIGSGGLYNNQKNPSRPTVVADKPVGEWNTFYIKMVGDRVWVKLNDQLVVDNVPLENYWERGKPLPAVGPIELQHHGNRLEWRNIFIRELPRTASSKAGAPASTVTMKVIETPLPHALRRVEEKAGVRVVMDDAALTDRRIGYAEVKAGSAAEAVEALAKAAGAYCYQDGSGVFHVSTRPR
jgi:hypothetical protein